jgi:hypothetical protein
MVGQHKDEMSASIPAKIFDYFAAHPAGPMLTFGREVSDPSEALRDSLEAFLSGFSSDDVAAAQANSEFQFFAGHDPDRDGAARIWLGERLLTSEIARQRLNTIREDQGKSRPRPYGLAALEDVQIDLDQLVPLSAFDFDGARLLRNEFASLMLATTGSPNSAYWLLAAIYDQELAGRTRVRLDPFLCGPAATFPQMHYRMWLYGRALDWERIQALQEPEHGRWMPDSSRARNEFTDFAWTPRGDEVHFVCEEIPESSDLEPARYLHAIYSRARGTIEHLDGAIRIYSRDEVQQRRALHARNAGKMGLRQKVFAIDGDIPPDALSQVAQAFFVWNSDVQQYFANTLAVGNGG